MSLLVDTDHYDPTLLGVALYRFTSMQEGEPPTWNMLEAQEQQLYIALAQDFVNYLTRVQSKMKALEKKRMWYFDYEKNTPRVAWMICQNARTLAVWYHYIGREKFTHKYGIDCFLTEEEAWEEGIATQKKLIKYQQQDLERMIAGFNDTQERNRQGAESDPDLSLDLAQLSGGQPITQDTST